MASPTPEMQQPAAYRIAAFCKAYSVSRAFLYRLWDEGRGPRYAKIGRRVLIGHADATEWFEHMGEATEQGGER